MNGISDETQRPPNGTQHPPNGRPTDGTQHPVNGRSTDVNDLHHHMQQLSIPSNATMMALQQQTARNYYNSTAPNGYHSNNNRYQSHLPNRPPPGVAGPPLRSINTGLGRRPIRHNALLADSSQAGLLKATNIPQGTTQRTFRKKIGHAVAAVFSDPPRFKAHVKSYKGKPEYGTIIFPNVDCCHKFLRYYSYHSGKSVEISKHKLHFRKEDPISQSVTQQEAACLRWKPGSNVQAENSDYEDDGEDNPVEILVQHVEAGLWDAQGQFAPAWCSKDLYDHYSNVTLDGDTATISIRIEEQLITIGLYYIDSLIVHDKDMYITTNILPTFLDDESGGFAVLKKTTGLMEMHGLAVDTKFIRTPALDEDHAKVAQYCYVHKIRCSSRDDLDNFLNRWKRKLIDVVDYFPIARSLDTPFANHHLIKLRKWFRTLPFELAFQAQSLLQDCLILPNELVQLQPAIESIAEALPPVKAARLFQLVARSAAYRQPAQVAQSDVASLSRDIAQHLAMAKTGRLGSLDTDESSGFFDIHAANISPVGITLVGPNRDTGNRIIRQFPGKESYFMRVRLQDETGDTIRENRDVNNDRKIFSTRLRQFLLNGIELGGRVFRFLAFSTSSLRDHSTWFVADFVHDGEHVSAQSIRDGIGNLKVIKIPAKYAARMGQAFTSTAFSLDVDSDKIHLLPDVSRNTYTFSDGCGVISYDTLKRLHEMDSRRRRNRRKNALPTVFQVRLGGAKGVLSLDTNFTGWSLGLRPSMIKFQLQEDTRGTPKVFLEIASSADSALPTNLNRPLVALLETLGVPPSHFVEIQTKAVKDLSVAATDTVAALKMYRAAGFGTAPDCSDLLQTLHRVLGIKGIVDVPFLKKCNMTCLTSSLRQIKYKARCKVEEAWTLMGVMDETGWLQPGHIYVQLRDNRTSQVTYLTGHCIVGRSPYLAPGDVQFAILAGAPPAGSTLHNIYNCVVFSQHGTRPLCNKLAGGDLDGDLYNVIKNPLLFPQGVEPPAAYRAVKPKELQRECTVEDVVDFLLIYCQTDRLGMIADRHLLISDRSVQGVKDPDCVRLAELASVAVDYQKTGKAPDLLKIPKLVDSARPDYFQSEHRVESQNRSLNRRAQWSRESRTYYESKKALGQMFRKIDVEADIASWGRSAPAPMSESDIRDRYWAKIRPWLKDDWMVEIEAVLSHVQTFYNRLEYFAQEYAPERRRDALSEPELFMGCILGRFASKYGTGNRGYNAQTALRDDISELIDQHMTENCRSEDWNVPVITAGNLSAMEKRGEDVHAAKAEVERILTCLARWIRAAEMFEDVQYTGVDESGNSKNTSTGDHYETAKWIAIRPALKKVEEINIFMAYWTAQVEARLAKLRASEDAAVYGAKVAKEGVAAQAVTYIANAPM